MSRTVNGTAFLARVRRLCDIENDTHVSDETILSFLADVYPQYWDLLIEVGPPEFHVKKQTFSTVAGQLEYDLNSNLLVTDGDFYKLRALFRRDLTNPIMRVPVRPFQVSEHEAWTPVDTVVSMEMHYYPHCPVISTSDASAVSIDGINGWEELLVQKVCKLVKQKRQEDFSQFANGEAMMEAKIRKAGSRDEWEPQRVVRRRDARRGLHPWADGRVDGYRIAGGKLELVRCAGAWYF